VASLLAKLQGARPDAGWSLALLDELRGVVFSLEPVEQVLEELILNSHYLTHRARGRGVFYPHN